MARAIRLVLACTLLAALLAAGRAGAASTVYVTFRTPSGNIGCAYSKLGGEQPGLRCEIVSGLKPLPPKPKRCGDGLWGRSVTMAATGRASRICVTDTVIDPRAKPLVYGKTWRQGKFVCTSKTTGLTCLNGSSHGWFLSRAKSRLF